MSTTVDKSILTQPVTILECPNETWILAIRFVWSYVIILFEMCPCCYWAVIRFFSYMKFYLAPCSPSYWINSSRTVVFYVDCGYMVCDAVSYC